MKPVMISARNVKVVCLQRHPFVVCACLFLSLIQGSMSTPNGENMDAGNLYGVMTIMSTLTLAPIAVIMEGAKLRGLWAAAMAAGHTKFSIVKGTVLSSLFFYMYK